MIELFGFEGCKWCDKAEELLQQHGLGYQKTNVFQDGIYATLAERLALVPGAKFSVPQIFIDGEHIGGFTELNRRLNPPQD